MRERVVHGTESSFEALLARAPHGPVRKLGEAAGGAQWAAMRDADILAAARAGVAPPILYFSTEDLDHAHRGLSKVEVDRAIRARLDSFSPEATNRSVDWLFRRERRALVLAAVAAESGPPLPEKALMDVFDISLARLARLSGGLRFEGVDAASMAVFALEGDADLLAQAEATPNAPWTTPAVDETRAFMEAAGPRLTTLGRPGYEGAPPYVAVDTVYWISPFDATLQDLFHHLHVPSRRWRGGLVAPWPTRKLHELRAVGGGRVVEPMYPSAGDFMVAMRGLTEAQADRDLDERLTRARRGGDDLAIERWNGLRVAQTLLRRSLVEALRREVPALAPAVESEVEHETHALRRALARHPSWIHGVDQGGAAAMAELERALEGLAEDTMFFAERCDIEGLPSVRDELRGAQASIEAAILRLRTP